MTVREDAFTAAELLAGDAAAAAVREVMTLPATQVAELVAETLTGDPLVQLAAAVLGDRYVDRYQAAAVLGMTLPASA
ncbi:hypothetical protein OG858_47330 (plasmid) [Streptomyces europaeiscabiei]|uniref:hypothetical protein n=1 Tax=Streptomyces europaeiscabiei TaxID=146819 RepID=UPI002E817023|nr:hypothetical protein [Streptomyces europaeiscabiei]WUD38813.1 hypothetical protein OG858_47330 [Streptomyces europaeiscabiei]